MTLVGSFPAICFAVVWQHPLRHIFRGGLVLGALPYENPLQYGSNPSDCLEEFCYCEENPRLLQESDFSSHIHTWVN